MGPSWGTWEFFLFLIGLPLLGIIAIYAYRRWKRLDKKTKHRITNLVELFLIGLLCVWAGLLVLTTLYS